MSSSNTFIHAFQEKIKKKEEHIDELKKRISRMKEVNSEEGEKVEQSK